MRKYLLTWYGITDFRASLGFEATDGPIAGALTTEIYSDVVVLCYTRADDDPNESAEQGTAFAGELTSLRDAGQECDWKKTGEFVSKFANTAAAHKHFCRWLETKFHTGDNSTKFWFVHEKLHELNDTEGIYSCAMRALDFVAQQAGEKLVTLNLSPGTPVMAFVWAFAALGHPDLKKRLIASPVIGKPPETISLPAEWLERHGANQVATRDVANGFDVTFHLFGEQRMPSLLGIRQFESKRHIFVNSAEFPAESMRTFITSGELDELPVDPWNARTVREKIIRAAGSMPHGTRIGINLTGGTKLMFAGALSAGRALGAVPFYFDSRNRRVTYVDSLRSDPIRPIDSVETFLLLNGDGLRLSNNDGMNEFSPDRRLLTKTLWKHRDALASHYKRLCEISNSRSPFGFEMDGFSFELTKHQVATVVGHGMDLRFEEATSFAKYLSGGWFEEYLYLKCKPYEDAGIIKDLRINVELSLDRENAEDKRRLRNSHNELDVVFTDGYSLYIAECKAGSVTQEQVMKLQNLVRFYGGVEGRGIVACCFPPRFDSVRKKIEDAKLLLCCGGGFEKQLKALMDGIAQTARALRG